MTSVSQQKMTLFFLSRSSSSFVALNATLVGYVFVRAKNDGFRDLQLLFRSGGLDGSFMLTFNGVQSKASSTCRPRSSLNWDPNRLHNLGPKWTWMQ